MRRYAGFWTRVAAMIIDIALLLMLVTPVLVLIFGTDPYVHQSLLQEVLGGLVSNVLPAIICLAFWHNSSATPGKMVMKIIIIDHKTGRRPSFKQFVLRYIGYAVSIVPMFIGLVWIGFNAKKRGFHDYIAGTVVIHRDEM